MTMGQRIKELRLQKGWTQEELGNKLGLQKSAIAKYENGRVSNLKASTILRMAEAFNVMPSYLMGWDDAPKEQIDDDMEKIVDSFAEDVEKLKIITETMEKMKNMNIKVLRRYAEILKVLDSDDDQEEGK